QCGRRLDALKLWLAWQALGDEGMRRRIDRLFELAAWFQERMKADPGFELVRQPQATNICFRWLPERIRALPQGTERNREAHRFTLGLRERLIRSGKLMINYATLDGAAVLRLVLLNPATTEEDLEYCAAAIR
ncbi:MAG: pyridoxal-dependent decarboxylase, partial [Planctomycetota bacterium]